MDMRRGFWEAFVVAGSGVRFVFVRSTNTLGAAIFRVPWLYELAVLAIEKIAHRLSAGLVRLGR